MSTRRRSIGPRSSQGPVRRKSDKRPKTTAAQKVVRAVKGYFPSSAAKKRKKNAAAYYSRPKQYRVRTEDGTRKWVTRGDK